MKIEKPRSNILDNVFKEKANLSCYELNTEWPK